MSPSLENAGCHADSHTPTNMEQVCRSVDMTPMAVCLLQIISPESNSRQATFSQGKRSALTGILWGRFTITGALNLTSSFSLFN